MKNSIKAVLLISTLSYVVGMTYAVSRDLELKGQAAPAAVAAPAPVAVEAPAPVVKSEVEPVESEYDRMPQECKDAGATPDECAQAAALLERVNEGPTWSGAEFDYNRSLVK